MVLMDFEIPKKRPLFFFVFQSVVTEPRRREKGGGHYTWEMLHSLMPGEHDQATPPLPPPRPFAVYANRGGV